jgi:hypothetical protein
MVRCSRSTSHDSMTPWRPYIGIFTSRSHSRLEVYPSGERRAPSPRAPLPLAWERGEGCGHIPSRYRKGAPTTSNSPVRCRSRGHADPPAEGRSSNLRRELVRARARSWRDVQGHLALSGNADGFLIDPTERSRSRSGQRRWSGLGHSILLTCSIVACSNHGNSLYGRCSSSSPSKIHSPCFDTLVTSTEEVLVPSIDNLHHVRT